MVEKFVQVEKCTRMSLIELGASFTVTDREIEVLLDLATVLLQVKHAVEG